MRGNVECWWLDFWEELKEEPAKWLVRVMKSDGVAFAAECNRTELAPGRCVTLSQRRDAGGPVSD